MKTQREGIQKVSETEIELRVAGGSNAPRTAGALVRFMEEGHDVSLIAMGAGAVNQAVKAIAIARGIVAPQGKNLVCIPGFKDELVDDVRKTAILLRVVVQ